MRMDSPGNPLARHGHLGYLEIPAIEPRRSAEFYRLVLGWSIDQRTSDDFRFTGADGSLIGRWVTSRTPREPGLLLYFYVDGIEAALSRVTANGGEIAEALRTEGDTRITKVLDPAGNSIGLWQFVE
jgi:predicted enzyme related to lactoylglutathione lyase